MCHGQAMIGWQGWGARSQKFPEPGPGLFSLHPVVIPEPHRASGLLEWKLLEDVWPHQVWPLLYFSHLELVLIVAVVAACKGKCAEGRC